MICLNCKTHFSLLRGFSKPEELAKKCKEYGYSSCVLADMNTISGAIAFHKACKNNNIKPIIGCDFGNYLLIAKNKDGWFDLIKCVSDQSIDTLKDVSKNKNLLCISGKVNGLASLFKNNFVQYDYQKDAVYYVEKEDAECHRILLCSSMKTTLPQAMQKIKNDQIDPETKVFFTSDDFYLKKPVKNKLLKEIELKCEDYDLVKSPILPKFSCPNNMQEGDYLRQLCREGWKKRNMNDKANTEELKKSYGDRVNKELGVIFRANLSGYFLVVQDIVNEIKRRNWLAGPGRGSAAGCLVSYLIGITEVDPIEHGLIFERFYNEGRNTETNVSLPDIDVDVPAEHRDEIIDYIKEKYGKENVSQMVTFEGFRAERLLRKFLE